MNNLERAARTHAFRQESPDRDGPGLDAYGRRPKDKQALRTAHLGVGGRAWTPLHARLLRSLQRSKLLGTESVLVAVSGGQDSVCLLQALVDLQPHWNWRLGVVHCDHGWRPDSADNADFVRRLAQRLGLPCYVRAAAPGAVLTERAAREWRYGVFAEIAAEEAFSTVVTAHTATDRAETLLLNLFRGAGPDGLVALSRLRPLGPDCGSDTDSDSAPDSHAVGSGRGRTHPEAVLLARPLLEFTREDTQGFVEKLGLPYYHDSTNDCNDIRRNRLRNQVMPLLREHFNPRLDQSLFRLLEVLEAEMEFMDVLTRVLYARLETSGLSAGADVAAQAADKQAAAGVDAARGVRERCECSGLEVSSLSSPPPRTDYGGRRDPSGSSDGAGPPVESTPSTLGCPAASESKLLSLAARVQGRVMQGEVAGSSDIDLDKVLGQLLERGRAVPRRRQCGERLAPLRDGDQALDVETLRNLPLALQRRLLQTWLRSAVSLRQAADDENGLRRRRNGCVEVRFQDVANCLDLLHAPNGSNSDSLCGGLVASVRGGKLLVKTPRKWNEWEEERRLAKRAAQEARAAAAAQPGGSRLEGAGPATDSGGVAARAAQLGTDVVPGSAFVGEEPQQSAVPQREQMRGQRRGTTGVRAPQATEAFVFRPTRQGLHGAAPVHAGVGASHSSRQPVLVHSSREAEAGAEPGPSSPVKMRRVLVPGHRPPLRLRRHAARYPGAG